MKRSEAYAILGRMWEDATAEQAKALSIAQDDIEFVDLMPKDMVAVVRCKDCEAWQTKTAMSFLRDGIHVRCCSCSVYGRLMYDDDFCSKGKRRADE